MADRSIARMQFLAAEPVAHRSASTKRIAPTAVGGRSRAGTFRLAHGAFQSDHRAVVYVAQLRVRRDGEGRHEAENFEPVGPPGARVFCLASRVSSSGMSASRSMTLDGFGRADSAGVGKAAVSVMLPP